MKADGFPNLWLIDTSREGIVGVEETERCGHCYEPLHLLIFFKKLKEVKEWEKP